MKINRSIMKRITTLALSAAMMFVCAACGAAGNAPGATAGQSDDRPTAEPGVIVRAEAIHHVELPEAAPYPKEDDFRKSDGMDWDAYSKAMDAWYAEMQARGEAIESYRSALDAYLAKAPAEFLAGHDGENVICSPLNIYMALAMLAECTDGQTRAQILDVLGAADLEALRKTAKALWDANYRNDGLLTEILGSSLWMNKEIIFREDTISNLALYYYATAYSGDMEDPKFFEAFQTWLDEQTGGLLQDQIGQLEPFKKNDVMAIATTIYFKGKWANEFNDAFNTADKFHSANGGDYGAIFMHSDRKGDYYRGDGFGAIRLEFEGDASMWVILPDEGVTPEKLSADGSLAAFMKDTESANDGRRIIHLSLPKFDISSSLKLSGSLAALGVTEAFDPKTADFTPLTATPEVYVSSVTHDARVKIDEEGCEAAAYTVIMAPTAALEMDPPEIDFTVDRPFIFVITGQDGLPMFEGIVNRPTE